MVAGVGALSELPPELWAAVVERLDPEDRCRAACATRALRAAAAQAPLPWLEVWLANRWAQANSWDLDERGRGAEEVGRLCAHADGALRSLEAWAGRHARLARDLTWGAPCWDWQPRLRAEHALCAERLLPLFTGLTRLYWEVPPGLGGWLVPPQLGALRRLHLRYFGDDDDEAPLPLGAAAAAAHPGLRMLLLDTRNSARPIQMQAGARFEQLHTLVLKCDYEGQATQGYEHLAHVALPSLRRLVVEQRRCGATCDLSGLGTLSTLRSLVLELGDVDPGRLRGLRALTGLRELALWGAAAGSADLTPPGVRILWLWPCTEEGFAVGLDRLPDSAQVVLVSCGSGFQEVSPNTTISVDCGQASRVFRAGDTDGIAVGRLGRRDVAVRFSPRLHDLRSVLTWDSDWDPALEDSELEDHFNLLDIFKHMDISE